MTHLLDSNACIRYLNGRAPSIRSSLTAMAAGSVVVCSVVKAELYSGAMRSTNPAQSRAKQQAFLN